MLQELSKDQLEQALRFLAQPTLDSVPQSLKELNPLEWHLLQSLLDNLLEEQRHSPLQ